MEGMEVWWKGWGCGERDGDVVEGMGCGGRDEGVVEGMGMGWRKD